MKCVACGEPATEVIRERHRAARHFCRRCYRDVIAVRKAYEKAIVPLYRQFTKGDHIRALRGFESLWKRYRNRDRDRSLARNVLADQALILADLGKHEEAMKRLRDRARLGFPDNSDFLVNQLSIARSLVAMGRPRSALRELEKGLRRTSGHAFYDALKLLGLYAEISKKHAWPLPRSYLPVVKATLQWWGIRIRPRLLKAARLTEAIEAAKSISRAAARRHQEFMVHEVEPARISDPTEKRALDLLSKYIRRERVGLYRRLAREYIEWIKAGTWGTDLSGSSEFD